MLEKILSNGSLPPRVRRRALETLSRDRLMELTERYGLQVSDRRAIENHIEALIKAAAVDFRDVLQELKRDELKEICAALDLDASGKEKDLLVERILASAGGESKNRATLTLTAQEPKTKRSGGLGGRGPSKPSAPGSSPTSDYRHDATRKNNPPAGLIDLDRPPPQPKKAYSYDPHLDPQLQWAGKAEHTSFEVDTVSLHIHERISTQAIMRAVKREDAQRDLFADSDLPGSKAIDFYAHEVGWANRLVLGDSLLVMNSLLEREEMAGKVQCIYMDPPYGVRFNSNFQPSISRRDVKDGDDGSLTREPEQIQAYRDTWALGVHSYLTYLRDRLLLTRDLLTDSGSIFVQISDENLHHVRELMDEVFGSDNFVSVISFKTTGGQSKRLLASDGDYIIWYARDRANIKFRKLYRARQAGDEGAERYKLALSPDGTHSRSLTEDELEGASPLPPGWRRYRLTSLTSQGFRENTSVPWTWRGKDYPTGNALNWKTTIEGLDRLDRAGRIELEGKRPAFRRFLDDFPVVKFTSTWTDTQTNYGGNKLFVVRTPEKVISRCLLMTTDPGDLVFDPTCGSGSTAFVAEQWGRRWITCDTSRVALAIARQRLLTSRFPYYRLRTTNVKDGFLYKQVPHIKLEDIANNPKLDSCKSRDEQERIIAAGATHEDLLDRPEEERARVRVSGPFTVEAIPVASMEDPDEAPEALDPDVPQDGIASPGRGGAHAADVGGDYVAHMIDLLRKNGGVHFKNDNTLPLTTIRALKTPHEYVHAESETGIEGDPRRVAVSFGPRHGPVTPKQVLEAIQQTRGYDIVLFVGFACDPEAGKMIETGAQGRELHFVHAAPDILVTDLLKTSKATKLFTVFGLPDVKLQKAKDPGEITVTLSGIDIYDPTTGETQHDEGESVAAWFLDHDYDGRTFCVCQALFPAGKMKNPWEKLQKALKGSIEEGKFEALRGTESIPFKPGKRIAVKVIDDRGNEVVKVSNVPAGLR